MCSAIDFLPRVMSTLTNFATSTLLYFGSGRMSRLGTSLRRGMVLLSQTLFSRESGRALGSFGFLGAVLGPRLLAVLHALGIEAAGHDVVSHASQVLHAAAADQDHRVLLQVVAFAANVADHLEPVGQAPL